MTIILQVEPMTVAQVAISVEVAMAVAQVAASVEGNTGSGAGGHC